MSVFGILKVASKGDDFMMLTVTKKVFIHQFLLAQPKQKRILKAANPSVAQRWARMLRVIISSIQDLGMTEQSAKKEADKKKKKKGGKKDIFDEEFEISAEEKGVFLQSLFLDYAGRGNVVEMKKLRGVNPKCKDSGGNTGLHLCAVGNHMEMAKYCVEKLKMNVNATNKAGDTPLHRAAWKNSFHVAQYLATNGANMTLRNGDGELALQLASDIKVKSLLEAYIGGDDDSDDDQDVDEDAD